MTAGKIVTATEVIETEADLDWDWYGWIPRAPEFIQFFGKQGLGKSTVGLYIAACYTDLWPWPGTNETLEEAAPVMIINADGKWAALLQRMHDFKLNTDLIAFPDLWYLETRRLKEPRESDRAAILGSLDDFEKTFRRLPALVILDGLSAYHGREEKSEKVANEVMDRLRTIMNRAECPMLLIHHERKTYPSHDGALPQERARGSGAWYAPCALQWHIRWRSKTDRVLQVTKSNLGPEPERIRISLPKKQGGLLKIEGTEGRPEAHTAKRRAITFLEEELAGGPEASKAIRDKAEEQGIYDKAVYQAFDHLKLRKFFKDRRAYWALPE